MQDRLFFQKNIFSNGVTVWSQELDVPFAQIRITLPVGLAHSHEINNGGRNGIAHFIEHLCFERSQLFPEQNSFEKLLSESGGDWNAWTTPFNTIFYMQAPAPAFDNLIPGFLSHIFEPIFEQSDIDIQKGTVTNERLQQKYFPGDEEIGNYKFTQWAHASFVSKEQTLGTDADLDLYTSDELYAFHSYYRSTPCNVIIGGSYDRKNLEKNLASIEFQEKNLISQFEPYSWGKREFHTMHADTIEMPLYVWGGFIPHLDLEESICIGFICDHLTNSQQGILNDVFRKEQGLTYGATSAHWRDRERMGWVIDIPLNSEKSVTHVRKNVHELTLASLTSETAIEKTRNRLMNSMCFEFQTVEDRISFATDSILCFNQNFTEKELQGWLTGLITTTSLLNIYEKYFGPEVSGEFLALPK